MWYSDADWSKEEIYMFLQHSFLCCFQIFSKPVENKLFPAEAGEIRLKDY